MKRRPRRKGMPNTEAVAQISTPSVVDDISLYCCKPYRGDNSVEFTGSSDSKGISVIMLSDSGCVLLDEEAEATLWGWLERRRLRHKRLAARQLPRGLSI